MRQQLIRQSVCLPSRRQRVRSPFTASLTPCSSTGQSIILIRWGQLVRLQPRRFKWASGLQGVVICPANRKSDGFDSHEVHSISQLVLDTGRVSRPQINLVIGIKHRIFLGELFYPMRPEMVHRKTNIHIGFCYCSMDKMSETRQESRS